MLFLLYIFNKNNIIELNILKIYYKTNDLYNLKLYKKNYMILNYLFLKYSIFKN